MLIPGVSCTQHHTQTWSLVSNETNDLVCVWCWVRAGDWWPRNPWSWYATNAACAEVSIWEPYLKLKIQQHSGPCVGGGCYKVAIRLSGMERQNGSESGAGEGWWRPPPPHPYSHPRPPRVALGCRHFWVPQSIPQSYGENIPFFQGDLQSTQNYAGCNIGHVALLRKHGLRLAVRLISACDPTWGNFS